MKTDTAARLTTLRNALAQEEPLLESASLMQAIGKHRLEDTPHTAKLLLTELHTFGTERFSVSITGRNEVKMTAYLAACFGAAQALLWRDALDGIEADQIREAVQRASEVAVEVQGDIPRPYGVPVLSLDDRTAQLPADFDREKIPPEILKTMDDGEPLSLPQLHQLFVQYVYALADEIGCATREVVAAARADLLPPTSLGKSVRCLVTLFDRIEEEPPRVG